MTATPTPCTITVRDIAGGGRPCYEVRHGTTVLARTHSHTQIRDALRKLAADCEAEGLVLEIDAGELAPTLVASWRAPLIEPPAVARTDTRGKAKKTR